ncbi:hypothetical protein DM01DRAFT_1008667 [Hesseltinella vesiculosa]|uniref:Uncharacterized protein n=1 Tax=Hesseltinella vesiculosa TaxID=101127 RepID=A0A1X2GXW8_9FUNG|nr:hypothetical protein DM01DRAFT_1008667 [Hesseltinella vesiculosa]
MTTEAKMHMNVHTVVQDRKLVLMPLSSVIESILVLLDKLSITCVSDGQVSAFMSVLITSCYRYFP